MSEAPTVYVVDDDQAVRSSVRWLLESVNLPVKTFGSALEFLEMHEPGKPGCLVLDVRMPGLNGLQLQETLTARRVRLPIIFITGHGDIDIAVRAMKAGAFDFIEKPFNDQSLVDTVQRCLALDDRQRRDAAEREKIIGRLASLTPREVEVLDYVISGKSNKLIAADLGISAKTVEVHRARVMEKMAVSSVAELTARCIASGRRQEKS